ncbi:MAG TPA: class I SAM-dependent methyltransferase [Gaiellaceae bacterium]|nr:class I SAM-dependent methyltransferase [Gaiellaceae bacterium]
MSTTTTSTGSAAVQGELWSERADDWADLMEPIEAPFHLAGLDQLAVGPGVSLLDVGCGSGAVLRIAADRGADVTGIDAAPALVAHARRLVPGAHVEVGDIQFLPFEDASFDIVTGFNSFQYAADRAAALREARRVLRDDGRVLMLVWGPPERCEGEIVLQAVRALLPPPPPGAPGPFALSEEGALAALLESTGFKTLIVADVPTAYEHADEAAYLRAWHSPGPCVMAIRQAGVQAFDNAIIDAGAPFRREDGSYRLNNVFRFAVAQAR